MNYPDQPDLAEQYEIVIYYAKEDGYFVAEVPELIAIAADGPTPQAAMDAARSDIVAWLKNAQEQGVEPPRPKGRVPFAIE